MEEVDKIVVISPRREVPSQKEIGDFQIVKQLAGKQGQVHFRGVKFQPDDKNDGDQQKTYG